jgi:phage terminase small subunit
MATKKKETLDPRQALFLEYYLKPGSETFSNIYQSAIKAGYSESYADNMRAKTLDWVSGNVGAVTKDELVVKAKTNLKKLLDSTDEKVQADITKFVAKTDAEFSEKTDITSAGKEIQPLLVKFVDNGNTNT